jgi:peptidoglycan hydrolase CwlO-like protein
MLIYDRESPPGAWQRELDSKLDTVGKLWNEIYELRERIKQYMEEIARLEQEVATLRHEAHNAWMREP